MILPGHSLAGHLNSRTCLGKVQILNFLLTLCTQSLDSFQNIRLKIEVPCQKPWPRAHSKSGDGKIQNCFSSLMGHGVSLTFRVPIHHCAKSPRRLGVERSKLKTACLVEVQGPGSGNGAAWDSGDKSNSGPLPSFTCSRSRSHGRSCQNSAILRLHRTQAMLQVLATG